MSSGLLEMEGHLYGTNNKRYCTTKMVETTRKFHIAGIRSGVISGLFYGLYSFVIMILQGFDPIKSAVGILAAPLSWGRLTIFSADACSY